MPYTTEHFIRQVEKIPFQSRDHFFITSPFYLRYNMALTRADLHSFSPWSTPSAQAVRGYLLAQSRRRTDMSILDPKLYQEYLAVKMNAPVNPDDWNVDEYLSFMAYLCRPDSKVMVLAFQDGDADNWKQAHIQIFPDQPKRDPCSNIPTVKVVVTIFLPETAPRGRPYEEIPAFVQEMLNMGAFGDLGASENETRSVVFEREFYGVAVQGYDAENSALLAMDLDLFRNRGEKRREDGDQDMHVDFLQLTVGFADEPREAVDWRWVGEGCGRLFDWV